MGIDGNAAGTAVVKATEHGVKGPGVPGAGPATRAGEIAHAPGELMAVRALELGDARPAASPSPRPQLEYVALADLVVNRRYQRELSERSRRLIRRIVAEFDWARLKAPNVRRHADGRCEVIDGQHTAIACATHGGIGQLPCLVQPAAGTAAHADAFVALNSVRVGVTPMQRFVAAVASGETGAVTVARAAERAGVRILRTSARKYRPGDTVAVTPLLALARHGEDGLARLLSIARKAGLAPISALHVRALARLLFAAEYAGDVRDEHLSAVVARHDEDMLDAADLMRLDQGGTRAHCYAVELYRRAS